jgi:hypothetical protein
LLIKIVKIKKKQNIKIAEKIKKKEGEKTEKDDEIIESANDSSSLNNKKKL